MNFRFSSLNWIPAATLLACGLAVFAQPCTMPANSMGTVDFPVDCAFDNADEDMVVTDGLPPSSSLVFSGPLQNYSSVVHEFGGNLDWGLDNFDGEFSWTVTGTGDLAGFSRTIPFPVSCVVHTGPRTPGDPMQQFDNEMVSCVGEIFGDPDFDELRIAVGSGEGLDPSPGRTTISELPSGDFAVDSFFDVTYRIEFTGAPGSMLDGMSGTQFGTVRLSNSAQEVTVAATAIDVEVSFDEDPTESRHVQYTEFSRDPWRTDYCSAPDNGTGTADFPPPCDFDEPGDTLLIEDGLPPGSKIILQGPLGNPGNPSHQPGGTLGGGIDTWTGDFSFRVLGTDALNGFQRTISVPVSCEVHTAARIPGEPVQTFATDFFALDASLIGDPDFDQLIITAGTDNGLPSPGETTMTQLPSGDFAVDSFFDITYQIDFVGAPGGSLDGLSGSTLGEMRHRTGTTIPWTRAASASSPWVHAGAAADGKEYMYRVQDDPTPQFTCIAPDNGTGTADLMPPCPYDSVTECFLIIDGLPPGTTIECCGPLENFMNLGHTPGGVLGGTIDDWEAQFTWELTGTGDLTGYYRFISFPVMGQDHTGPRNPGDPVQAFDTLLFQGFGELLGDPDFDLLRIVMGDDYGLPCPGQTTLTDLGTGDWGVDSFFDITYQIEFMGAPGSVLEGYSGMTTGTIRLTAE